MSKFTNQRTEYMLQSSWDNCTTMRGHFVPYFCFALLMAVSSLNGHAQESGTKAVQDTWYGELDAVSRVFRFIIKSSAANADEVIAELTSLDEGGAKFKLDDVVIDGKQFKFNLKSTNATYQSQLSVDRRTATGNWSQRGAKLDLVFEKRDKVPQDAPDEVWLGTLNAGFQKLDIQVRVYLAPDGKKNAFVDSVSQNSGGFKADLEVDGNKVTIDVPALKAKYVGERNGDATEIVGTWSQGIPLPLRLARVNSVAPPERAVPKRPQTPQKPFPYDVEEVTFKNESDGTILAGTLTRPKSGKPFPVAILISGSGPQDRDESILDHKPFWVLADYLTRRGVAVLRFDDRGVGKSTGKFEKATTEDFASDVRSAISFVKTAESIDAVRVGLIGHSEGGLVATLVAAGNEDVAWVVLMASPGVNGEEILFSQGQLIVAAEGGNEAARKRQRLLQEHVFAKAKEMKVSDDIEPFVTDIVNKIIASANDINSKDKPENPKSDESEKINRIVLTELVRANLKAMNDPWFRYFASYEPGPDLQRIKCPVLAINGEKDVQVDPKLNLSKIESSLRAGGNRTFLVQELLGLNHLFQTSSTGKISEYQSIEETISPLALESISKWLTSQIENRHSPLLRQPLRGLNKSQLPMACQPLRGLN